MLALLTWRAARGGARVQVGLPKWWLAGAEQYPIDNTTLAIIELVVFAFLEGTRYEGYKKTGAVRASAAVLCLGSFAVPRRAGLGHDARFTPRVRTLTRLWDVGHVAACTRRRAWPSSSPLTPWA